MCPGGYVVAAASEEGGVVTNGMSYADREGENANAALLVTVNPQDFPYEGPCKTLAEGLVFFKNARKTGFRGRYLPVIVW